MVEPTSSKSVKFTEEPRDESDESNEESDELDRQFNKFQLLNFMENNEEFGEEGGETIDCNDESDDGSNQKQTEKSSSQAKNKKTSRRRKGKSGKRKDNPLDGNQFVSNPETYRENANDTDLLHQVRDSSHLDLLRVDWRHLVPENELKRMFGRGVVRENGKSRAKHNLMSVPGPSGNLRSRFSPNISYDSKSLQMSSIPRMELDDSFNHQQTTDGQNTTTSHAPKKPLYFKFVHDKAYQAAHNMFLDAAQQGFSEAIIQNLTIFPSHIESLIQLCDMMRISEDFKAASEMIERALALFERGFHPKFNITTGLCRLSYKRPENRSFFITIFKHIMFTSRRGLRRTPLEYTKLLLSLDPENDPLFASLLIDFYAIRSEEYDYLISFISKWQHLSKLPNINFSLALAHFMQSKSLKRGKAACEDSSKMADECLQQALVRYPNFIIPLLDACSAEPSRELLESRYFNYSIYSTKYKDQVPESVDLLVNLYVQRNLCLWKTKEVLAWLEKNVSKMVKEMRDEGQNVEYWASFRGPAPRNLLRHVVLSELKVKVPSTATSSSYLDIDPYPPLECIISYRRDNSTSSTNQGADTNSTPLGFSTLFLRSMLPSFGLSDTATPDRNQPAPR